MVKPPPKYSLELDLMRSLSLEELFMTPYLGFGATTATPLQRAILRIIDGKPLGELASHSHVIGSLGLSKTVQLDFRPIHVQLLSAARCWKTLISVTRSFHASQHVDVSVVGPGDTIRVSLLSINSKLAKTSFKMLLGRIKNSPVLSQVLVEEPTAETIKVFHPSGHVVEICIVAANRAGAAVASDWSAGAVFDEMPRMLGVDDAVVNFDETYENLLPRLLPGASILSPGTPHMPWGPAYRNYRNYFGNPSEDCVVIQARGDWLNPSYWTPERQDELRKRSYSSYTRDFLAQFLQANESYFTLESLRLNTRKDFQLPPEPRRDYVAGMDPAAGGNGWTLTICSMDSEKHRIDYVREWKATDTAYLDPKQILQEIVGVCRQYRIANVYTDQWEFHALKSMAAEYGLSLVKPRWTEKLKDEVIMFVKTKLEAGEFELHPDATLQEDLAMVRRKPTKSGFSVDLPHTSDGRHCDYIPALQAAVFQQMGDLAPEEPKPKTDLDFAEELVAQNKRRIQWANTRKEAGFR